MRARSLAVLVLSVLLVGTAVPLHVAAADTPAPAQRSITVSGEGTIYVSPDEAFVTVGVQQTDPQAAQAQAAANTVTAAAIARIKALGVADRDIQTVGISLDPQYDDRGVVIGFVASDTLSVTVEQPRRAGAVIDAGVGAGANRDVSVSFGLKNDSQARSAALRAAVAQGQQKAAVKAKLAAQLHSGSTNRFWTQAVRPTAKSTIKYGSISPLRKNSSLHHCNENIKVIG